MANDTDVPSKNGHVVDDAIKAGGAVTVADPLPSTPSTSSKKAAGPPPVEVSDEIFREAVKRKGYRIDICDTNEIWLEGEIIDVMMANPNQPKIKVHYTHFHRAYDEWVSALSERVAPLRTHSSRDTLREAIARHKLMPKGAKPPPLDDSDTDEEARGPDPFNEMEDTACRCVIQ